MAAIIEQHIVSDRPQRSGRRFVRYRYVIEDNVGVRADYFVGPKLVGEAFDAQADLLAAGATMLDDLAEHEIQRVIRELSKGINPLSAPTRFADYNAVVSRALRYFLAHADPTVAVKAQPFIANLTDDEIMALLQVDAQMVADIRALAATWASTGEQIRDYVPLLGGE